MAVKTVSKWIGEGKAKGELYKIFAFDTNKGVETKDMRFNTDYKQYFREAATYINSSESGKLDLVATTVAITGNLTVSGSITYGATEVPVSTNYMGDLTVGIDDYGYDVKMYGATSGKYAMWDASADKLILIGSLDVGVNDTGHDVKFYTATSGSYVMIDESGDDLLITGVDTTMTGKLTVGVDDTGHDVTFYTATSGSKVMVDESEDAFLITAVNTTMTGTLTVGVDDTGHDVKFFGATSGSYWQWDESEDKMNVVGAVGITGAVAQTGNYGLVGTLTVGINGTGHDVKFYGATSGAYALWDESDDRLVLTKAGIDIGVTDYSIDFIGTPTTAVFKLLDDQTIASDSNEAVLADISATANAGFIKVIVGASTRYIALYDAKAS